VNKTSEIKTEIKRKMSRGKKGKHKISKKIQNSGKPEANPKMSIDKVVQLGKWPTAWK